MRGGESQDREEPRQRSSDLGHAMGLRRSDKVMTADQDSQERCQAGLAGAQGFRNTGLVHSRSSSPFVGGVGAGAASHRTARAGVSPRAAAEWTPGAAIATFGMALMMRPTVLGTAREPGEMVAVKSFEPEM